ncbi:MAG: NAD(P)H-binding protein, partial [Bacteroidota bacterium]|nr:NAD(P)H-binding protein [Bacteroidota bacterium]
MKKAIVIGATGMVGTQLIQLLLRDNDYSEIVSFGRHSSGITDPKLKELLINFDQPETWSKKITGDVLFSTLGTTIAQAKTKEAQYQVDFTYQYNVAEIAAKNGVSHYVLISSAGANSKSKNFYIRIKGELEVAVQALPFIKISILRPGQLDGKRIQKRLAER